MIPCISVENMRNSDAKTIATITPSLELMHRAAYGVFRAVNWKGKSAIVVGSGNNGGDGFALACILQEAGHPCTVFTVSQRMSQDGAFYAEKAKTAGVPIVPFETGCLGGVDMVVDCLLGTGFQGPVRETYGAAIEAINASHAYVVSVDINSGMNGDTGEGTRVVRSDLTVTIGYVKRGLVAPNSGHWMKQLVCVDIGIRLEKQEWMIYDPQEPAREGGIPCPPWLDMVPIQAVTE